MNLLTIELSASKNEMDMARDQILRDLKLGVEKTLTGDFDHMHVILLRLDGIWCAFTCHPLGHLAHRAKILIDAAHSHYRGTPYILTPIGRQLAGLAEGEPA